MIRSADRPPRRRRPKTRSSSAVVFSSALPSLFLLLAVTAPAVECQQQRFFLPSVNAENFALAQGQFQDDAVGAELIASQRRLSSAEAGASNFFSSQSQLPLGAFTNSGPFSRPPTAQQFVLNGQQAQFQPVRSAGSLSFSDAASAIAPPSFFQQPPPSAGQRPQPQTFGFFPGGSSQQQQQQQQQRFRPIAQQQRPDSVEDFDENKNSPSPLALQPSSQERFPGSSSPPRRPQQQPGRNPAAGGSSGWWTLDGDPAAVDEEVADGAKEDAAEFGQQNQNQQQKRGRGQPSQGRRRPAATPPVPSSVESSLDEQEPAAIGFTVIHDANDDDKSLWSQPTVTTHRPQLAGQTSFRARTSPPAANPGPNRRPTTHNPSPSVASSTSARTPPLQPTTFNPNALNRQQPTTFRSRKPTPTTTTAATFDDEFDEERQPEEEKRQFPSRKIATTQPPPAPVTTSRSQTKPRLNNPVASAVPQQQRMKKVVNSPAVVQNAVTARKPISTSTTSTSAPSTTAGATEEEYEDYEDAEYTTTEQPSNKKQTKSPPATQSPVKTASPKNSSLSTTTESWFVVASVQTSRSVSSSSSSSGGGANQNATAQDVTTSTTTTPTVNKHRFNNKPTVTTTSTTTVESIIDKLDRVQSELSNGILYGSASNGNNSRRILTDIHSDDKRNDVVKPSLTTPTTEKVAAPAVTTTPTTTTTTTSTTTTGKTDEDEDDEEEKEEDESEDTSKETTFVRKFTPSKQRTTTVSTTSTTTKPPTQTGKKKSLIDSVKFDELLTSGLLPPGFNPKPPPAYKSKVITTTTTTETPLPASNISSSSSDVTANTTPSTTTAKTKSTGLKIKFADDSSALASLLPPGFKLEESIKPVEKLPPSLLPPGYKAPAENADADGKNKEQEAAPATTLAPSTDAPSTTAKTAAGSTAGIVFPSNSKGTNGTGTRKPLPSSKKIQASVTIAPVIQKGWPVRATTEFTGWSTPSTTPLSIEKLLSQTKTPDLAGIASTPEPTTASTTTTTTTTTMKPPPTTTPGQCSESDSVCELVGTVRIVGSGSEKWVPELLDHNTAEWRLLANEVESQLDKVYSKSPALSKWYKKITIDSFSPGNNGIGGGKPADKNAGILVDFFVQLNQLGRTVSTADIRRLFHETLQKEGSLGSSAQPLQYGNGGDYDGLYLKMGRFTVDPARTDFIVLPKPTRGVTAIAGTEDAWLPQWAVAVMVIGLASLLFVLIFGITVLVARHKNNKKVPPPTIQTMIPDDHHQHVYGTGKGGPAVGGRHAMHHPPTHPSSNYNVGSYGYDNYAIDDDMMMLDEDDLEDVDRLYDMDAVWTDHDHDKHKAPSNSSTKKYRDTHYDSWRSTALSPQALSPVKSQGYYPSGGYGYGTDPGGYGGADRRHYHRETSSATNPRSSHHHYSHHNPNTSYPTTPRKPPQQYHPDYDTDF